MYCSVKTVLVFVHEYTIGTNIYGIHKPLKLMIGNLKSIALIHTKMIQMGAGLARIYDETSSMWYLNAEMSM